MANFRILTSRFNWTVKDDPADEPEVFFNTHYHKTPTGQQFLIVDNNIINVEHIIAVEKI